MKKEDGKRRSRRALVLMFVVAAITLSIGGFFDIGPKLEKMVGRQTAAGMQKDPGYNQTPLLVRYVNTLGGRLGKAADRKNITYQYNVVNMDDENAFAAGAGYTFITMGLLKMSDTEDEVASVLAHETGHNSDKHVIQAVKDNLAISALYLGLASQMSNDQAYLFGALAQLRSLKYGRADEYRADQLGVRYASRGGYNPYYMITEFEKLEAAHPTGRMSKIDVALASHPRTPDRMRRIQGEINLLEADANQSYDLGRALFSRGFYKESQHYLLAAEKDDPKNSKIQLTLAQVSQALGDSAASQRYLARAKETDPAARLPASNIILASAPVKGQPTDYSDLVNSLGSQEAVMASMVETDRNALNDAVDRLDKVAELQAQQAAQRQRQGAPPLGTSPAFQAAVNAVNELTALYAADNNMKRVVAKSKAMLDRTKDVPQLYPGDVRQAANCLIGPGASWGDRDKAAAPAIRDTIFAYASLPQFYDNAPVAMQDAMKKAKSERERKEVALKVAFECADNLYALRITDVFYALEDRYPGVGTDYLAEKTGQDRMAVSTGVKANPKVGYYLAGLNLQQRYIKDPKRDPKKNTMDFFNAPVQAEQDKEGLWTCYNLVVGDLYRLYAGPQYSPPQVVIEVKKTPVKAVAAPAQKADKPKSTPELPFH